MLVIYENPGFEHSIASILLFQEDDTAPYWSDALYYFYPHVDKKKILSISITERGQYLTEVLRNVWDDLSKELDQKFPNMEKSLSRLIKFLEILKDHHLITYSEKKSNSNTKTC